MTTSKKKKSYIISPNENIRNEIIEIRKYISNLIKNCDHKYSKLFGNEIKNQNLYRHEWWNITTNTDPVNDKLDILKFEKYCNKNKRIYRWGFDNSVYVNKVNFNLFIYYKLFDDINSDSIYDIFNNNLIKQFNKYELNIYSLKTKLNSLTDYELMKILREQSKLIRYIYSHRQTFEMWKLLIDMRMNMEMEIKQKMILKDILKYLKEDVKEYKEIIEYYKFMTL
jgi:hypothetical protein